MLQRDEYLFFNCNSSSINKSISKNTNSRCMEVIINYLMLLKIYRIKFINYETYLQTFETYVTHMLNDAYNNMLHICLRMRIFILLF